MVMQAADERSVVAIVDDVACWLNNVVIGLNLCPFSARPTREKRVRFFVSCGTDEEALLQVLASEMVLLDQTPAAEIETTLVIVPDFLVDFFDYNQFLSSVERLIKRNRYTGVFQVASFHPAYCFAGAAPEDSENLTNRSPYPLFHIIREASLEAALEHYPDASSIPVVNQARVEALTAAERRILFPYLFG